MKTNFFIIFYLLIFLNNSIGQINNIENLIPNIVPPPPETYSLGKYGNVPIGLFTGSTNISIPLFNLSSGEIATPITMTYSSNGIKVDERESLLGLGWQINLGGLITRVVRDKPDEEMTYDSYYLPKEMIEKLNVKSPQSQEYFEHNFRNDTDSEDDLFMINVNGISGKFHIKNGNTIQLIDNQNIKVLFDYDSTDTYVFKIIDDNGFIYEFDESQFTVSRTIDNGHNPPSRPNYSAWYLTKIRSPNGDIVNFEYSNSSKDFISYQYQNMKRSYPYMQFYLGGESYIQPPNISPLYSVRNIVTEKVLRKIYDSNNNSVEFTYNNNLLKDIIIKNGYSQEIEKIDFTFVNTINNRSFLDEIHFKDTEKYYSFDYITPELFPTRLSFAKDSWGYFNGALDNTNLIPNNLIGYDLENYEYNGSNREPNSNFSEIGLLNKIRYPTMGFTKIEYEPNDYYGDKVILPPQETINLIVETDDSAMGPQFETNELYSPINQKIEVNGISHFNNALCGPNYDLGNLRHNGIFSILDLDENSYVDLMTTSMTGPSNLGISVKIPRDDSINFYFIAQPNKNYLFKLSVLRNCTISSANFSYYPTTDTIQTNLQAAGVRVQRTEDFANDNAQPVIKKYFYSKFTELDKSSGVKGYNPFYLSKGYVTEPIPGLGNQPATNINVTSSSIANLFDTNNSNLYYKYVTISEGGDNFENGGQEVEFIVNRDYFGETVWYSKPLVDGLDEDRTAPFTNFGWNNGYEKNRKIFSSNGTTIKEIKKYYDKIDLTSSPQFHFNPTRFWVDYLNAHSYLCTPEDRTFQYQNYVCTTEHIHFSVDENHFLCIAENANNIVNTINHVCYNLPANTILNHNHENTTLTVTKYKNLSYHSYLKKEVETSFSENGELLNTKDISLRNEYPFQIRSSAMTVSNNSVLKTSFQYPLDLIGEENLMVNLVKNNRLAQPVITTTTKVVNGVEHKLTEQKTEFAQDRSTGNLILPHKIYTKKGEGDIDIIENLIISFDNYDLKGNLLKYTIADGMPVRIVWGYNLQYPIIKIQGDFAFANTKAYKGFIKRIIELSNKEFSIEDEEFLITIMNEFRNLPEMKETMITTYTYDPLIGVTSITPPNGQSAYYEYDDFRRLKSIKDQVGNKVQDIQYHYKANPE